MLITTLGRSFDIVDLMVKFMKKKHDILWHVIQMCENSMVTK